jgi:hypothetical protein
LLNVPNSSRLSGDCLLSNGCEDSNLYLHE